MFESFVFLLLIIGTVIGAVGGFAGATIIFFPIRMFEWLLAEEKSDVVDENILEYPQGT